MTEKIEGNESPAFIVKSEKFVTAGYASPNIIDNQGQRLSLKALDEGFKKLMVKESRRNYIFHHGNIQIGEVLWKYTDSEGNVFKSGVDFDGELNKESLHAYGRKPEHGLFVVTELFQDQLSSQEVIKEMNKGRLLNYSIGGRVLPGGHETVCDGNVCWDEVTKLELNEITACERGINPQAQAFILKGIELECECVDSKVNEPKENVETTQKRVDNSYKSRLERILYTNLQKTGKKEMTDLETEAKTLKDEIVELTKLLKAKPKETVKYFFGRPKREHFETDTDYHVELGAYHALLEQKTTEIESALPEDLTEVQKEACRKDVSSRVKAGESVKSAVKSWKASMKKLEKTKVKIEEKKPEEKKIEKNYFKKPEEGDEDYEAKLTAYNALITEIQTGITEAKGGELVKKGVIPTKKDLGEKKPVDFDKLMKDADEASSFKKFIGEI